jgi:integrase/recombinase XerD
LHPTPEAAKADVRVAVCGTWLIQFTKRAKLTNKPKLHGFRRAFALNMLRSGVDIFALQRLMGHADLQVLRRYLAQNDEDNQLAHMRGGPVDNNF